MNHMSNPTYYQTVPETGELVSPAPIEAKEDPRTPGNYFFPRGHVITESTPPAVEEGHACVWKGTQWEGVEDHRGKQGWVDGSSVFIENLGPLPEGWSDTLPVPEPDDRTLARDALAAEWRDLPDWVRGPCDPIFESASRLLDKGEDSAAIALIDYASPPPTYDAEQIDVFAGLAAHFSAAIASLPPAPSPDPA